MTGRFCPHCMSDIPQDAVWCPNCGKDTNPHPADSSRRSQMNNSLPPGTVLGTPNGSSYLLGLSMGAGGFGITYIARHMNSGRVVAIKEYFPTRCHITRLGGALKPDSTMEEIYLKGKKSFLGEASMLKAVDSIPSIVHVLDYFEANNTAYMVMEYLNGTTLHKMVEKQGRLRFDILCGKMLVLMKDMERLHAAGVIHRDIAPDNIMWMPDGKLKLLDFGCARTMEDGRSMTVMLKPGFAPIEQYQTRGQGPFTDIYAVCATIYYCICAASLPSAPDRLIGGMNNQSDPLLPPSALGVPITPEQEQVLMWGLSVQAVSRPQNMGEIIPRLAAPLSESAPVRETPAAADGQAQAASGNGSAMPRSEDPDSLMNGQTDIRPPAPEAPQPVFGGTVGERGPGAAGANDGSGGAYTPARPKSFWEQYRAAVIGFAVAGGIVLLAILFAL